MNVTLIFKKSKFNVDVLKDTPCQYLFNVVNKIFRIPINQIKLTYENIEIKNNSRLVFSVMGKTDPDNIKGNETIIVERKNALLKQNSLGGILNHNVIRNSKYNMISYLDSSSKMLPKLNGAASPELFSKPLSILKSKKRDKYIMKCQICNIKNSIFYCRVCNLFVCFECNVRFNEHKNHERINLEDGDSFLGCDVYREEIINEINIIELGYQQTLEWMIDNQDREDFLQSLFKSLEQIRNHSLNLADMKTLYNLDQEIINDFRVEVDKIPRPRHREEILEIFGSLNLKENELRNYTKFLNLQIIKTEYNKVLLKCLDKVKKNIDQLGLEVKSRLAECEDIKFRNIEDINIYLKESKLEKNQMDIENYLAKDNIENNNHKNQINKNNNNNTINIINNRLNSNKKIIQKKNTLNSKNNSNNNSNNNSLKKDKKDSRNNNFKEKEGNKTVEKKIKPLNLIGSFEDKKKKYKIKELNITNNINSPNNTIKKRELLIPLKIKKKQIIKNSSVLDEISNIEKPKNLRKFFNTKQELSEADFQEFPFKLKKNENNNDKKDDTPSKEASEDNDLNNQDEEMDKATRNNLILKNIDLNKFVGVEKKIFFNSPIKTKETSYGKTIFNKNKAKNIFENKD